MLLELAGQDGLADLLMPGIGLLPPILAGKDGLAGVGLPGLGIIPLVLAGQNVLAGLLVPRFSLRILLARSSFTIGCFFMSTNSFFIPLNSPTILDHFLYFYGSPGSLLLCRLYSQTLCNGRLASYLASLSLASSFVLMTYYPPLS